MATVTRENIGKLHDKITVTLSKNDYFLPIEKTLRQYAKTANVPGFRKGMVPAGMVRKMYGQQVFMDEIIKVAGRQLDSYISKEQLQIFAQPMILPSENNANLDFNATPDVDFSFEIGLKPEFEITPLKNRTTLTRYHVTVGDKLLEDEIGRIQHRYGQTVDRDAVTAKDDTIHYTIEQCDAEGNIYTGGYKVEDNATLDKFPAGLQELLQDKKAGDHFVFVPSKVTTENELQGFLRNTMKLGEQATSQFFVFTVTKVTAVITQELGPDLYMQVYPNEMITDEADFKARIRKELEREFERITEERLQNEIYELLVHNTPMELPVPFLKRWMKEGGEQRKTQTEVDQEFGSFDHQLRWTLISDKLINENHIIVTRDEVINDVKSKVLAYFGLDADDDAPWMESYMAKVSKDEKTMDDTYRQLLFGKLFNYLEQQFDVEEKVVTEEEFFAIPSAHDAHHHHH